MQFRHVTTGPLARASVSGVFAAIAIGSACVEVEENQTTSASASLERTEADGVLRVGEDGELVADRDAQWFYDYFLTAEGELPPAELRAELAEEAHTRLEPELAAQAVELFDAYVAYRREAAEIGTEEEISIDEVAEELRAAHDRHLGGVAGFSHERERIDRAVAAARALADDELDAEATREELEGILEASDDRVRERATAPSEMYWEAREAREAGADDDEIFAMRAERLGEAAASRLEALENERASWRARVEGYRREARRLEEEVEGEDARERAREELKRERFSAAEIRRLRALESAGPSSAPR